MTVPDDRLAMFCVANFMAFFQIADIFSFWSRQTDGEKDRQRPLVWLKIQQYFQIKLKGSIQINDLQWSVNYFHGMLQREVAAGPRLENQNRVFFWQLLLWKYSQKKRGAYPGYECMHPGFSFPFKYPKSSLNPFCSLKQNGAETAVFSLTRQSAPMSSFIWSSLKVHKFLNMTWGAFAGFSKSIGTATHIMRT